ncbi:unnamed protein product [Acanthoscelides obtectus]|uniref:Uncharacterized protein n=1 Tax=Acanthoscelides obtectus TaxID=200917 RepID=A0A9P0Q376_ACAOB|nr:unnamed protein product [Acanthoscelides obtectus]CAK1648815.1 hypothetical protein AOBTE_LOCUS15897 [Acanthoscelides obtectus]
MQHCLKCCRCLAQCLVGSHLRFLSSNPPSGLQGLKWLGLYSLRLDSCKAQTVHYMPRLRNKRQWPKNLCLRKKSGEVHGLGLLSGIKT